SRVAMDYLHPVLFIQAWVWCLADFLKIHRERSLMIGSVILGFGVYSYIASLVMMPIYVALTIGCLLIAHRLNPARAVRVLVCFALPLAIAALWLWTHPGVFAQTSQRYKIASQLAMVASGSAAYPFDFSLPAIVLQSLAVYWSYFNP